MKLPKTKTPNPLLNVHAILPSSCANGPGVRAVVWTQGCSRQCPGCRNPLTHSHEPHALIEPDQLVEAIAAVVSVRIWLRFSLNETNLRAANICRRGIGHLVWWEKVKSVKKSYFFSSLKVFSFCEDFLAGHLPLGQSSASTLALAGTKHLQIEHHRDRTISYLNLQAWHTRIRSSVNSYLTPSKARTLP